MDLANENYNRKYKRSKGHSERGLGYGNKKCCTYPQTPEFAKKTKSWCGAKRPARGTAVPNGTEVRTTLSFVNND